MAVPASLAGQLSQRTKELRAPSIHIPPFAYTYGKTDRKKTVRRESLNYDANIPFLHETTRYIQIDQPNSAATRRFNAGMQRWRKDSLEATYGDAARPGDSFKGYDGGGTLSIRQSVVSASAEMASVVSNSDAYWGGAHPIEFAQFRHWSFRLSRFLGTNEILRSSHDTRLIGLVRSHWQGAETGMSMKGCAQQISEASTDRASIDPKGITFWMIDRPCIGKSALTWTELQPFLTSHLPFNPQKLQANAQTELPF